MRRLLTILLAIVLAGAGAGYLSPTVRYHETFAVLSAARTLRTSGLHSLSLPFYTLAMAGAPTAAMIPQARGLAYKAMGHHEAAVADFSRALELDPKDAKSYVFRAFSHLALTRYEDAVADFSKAIATKDAEDLPILHKSRGIAYSKLKRLQEAIQDYERVVVLRPLDPKGHLLLALAQSEAGNPELAKTALDTGEARVCGTERKHAACAKDFPEMRELILKRTGLGTGGAVASRR